MTNQQVPLSLRNLLADTFSVPPEEITPNLGLGEISAWDSFGHLQAILLIEAEYGIRFDPQRIPELTTVSKLHTELEAKGATL